MVESQISLKSDDELFASLLDGNRKRIFGFILSLVPNLSDADDLLQETVLIMWRKFDQFEADKCFATWGVGIAYNKILQFRRSQSKLNLPISDEAFEKISEKADIINIPLNDTSDALEVCIKKLNSKDQALINLKYDHKEKIKDISDIVKRSADSLYKDFSRIHNMLRICIDRQLAK